MINPILMKPAFRHGDMTPWGGDKLAEMFHKDTPDDQTGESMEVSVIPGLESTDENGTTLTALIEKYGRELTGLPAGTVFPLLLKLIDAHDTLSVQVHPDDAYAAAHENKLGKTEAWVVLSCEEGAELVYGINKGVTKEALRAAAENGREIESLLKRVPVEAGDVFFIPAGMVHAIGKGIVLYEIQQSSDVTYRFYDWDRVNDKGEKRPLHVQQALDVTNLSLSTEKKHLPEGEGIHTVLDNDVFLLESLNADGVLRLPESNVFRLLTALEETSICWEGGHYHLHTGDTVFLPATCPKVSVLGMGCVALLAKPAVK